MKLKSKYAKKEDIPSGMESLFTEKNGEWILTEVEGIKTQADVDYVKDALQKERNEHKATKDKLSTFGDMDPDEVKQKLDKIPELEIRASKSQLSDEELNKLVEARIGQRLAPVERERDKLKTQVAERDGLIENFTKEKRTRTLHDAVREAIGKAKGFAPTAAEDAIVFGERMLELTEDGRVVTKDNIGVTPGVDATVWLSDMQAKKPHWFGPSQGGGSNGSTNGSAFGDNPFSAKHWNMTAQGQLVKENPQRAEQMAKAAGTTIGGPKPLEK